jgi:hypothetical protein
MMSKNPASNQPRLGTVDSSVIVTFVNRASDAF